MTEFVKHDGEKNRLDLIPFRAMEEVGKVLTYGSRKYSDHNWSKCPTRGRYLGAMLRHAFAYGRGEDLDPETGLSHMAHAVCSGLFLLGLILDGKAKDDRDKPGPAERRSRSWFSNVGVMCLDCGAWITIGYTGFDGRLRCVACDSERYPNAPNPNP